MSADAPENLAPRPGLPPHAPQVRLSAAHNGATVSCEVAAPVILIGSRRDCHLALPHPDISKIHAAVINTGRAILVRDLLSRTGTFVNNEVIRTGSLNIGDRLRVGPVEFELEPLDTGSGPSGAAVEDAADALRLPTALRFELGSDSIELADNALVIGRRDAADLMIDTPDVSLAHALVFALDGRPAIFDLGSRSGTFVNGRRIDLCWLADGDELELGGERVTVHYSAADEAVAAAAPPEEPVDEPPPPVEAVPEPIPELQPVVFSPDAPGTLGGLEESIAAVRKHISAARARIDARALELEDREQDYVRQVEELESRRHELEQAEVGLQRRGAEVDSLEQTVQRKLSDAATCEQALQEQAAALAAEREECARERGELESLRAALDEQRGGLQAEHEALAAEQTRLQETRSALDEQQRTLDEAAEARGQREQQLAERANQLDADAQQLAGERADLQAERAELEGQQTGCAAAAQQLEQREAELARREDALEPTRRALAEREAALQASEQQLAQREASLGRREAQSAEMLERIEEFRTTLSQAGELFAADPSRAAKRTAEPASRAPAQVDAATSEATEAQDPEAVEEELPAPVVAQPLFSAEAGAPPADWPPELCERFRVLRRVSSKTDQELLAQVWADRGRMLRGGSSPPAAGRGKKKRNFWGN